MQTKIFTSYSDFRDREDKTLNGVSEEFARSHPDYENENETNRACYNCSDCSYCSYCYNCSKCSDCSKCSKCYNCSDCSYCSYCYNCSKCSDCSYCSDCSDCSYCYNCSKCSKCMNKNELQPSKKGKMEIPIIKNIHQTIFKAASIPPEALNMTDWHTCETTHCRGGWVTFLAGKKGKVLENQTTTLFAAMQIYKASSPIRVSPARFFEDNKTALADMKRCAEEESKLKVKKKK